MNPRTLANAVHARALASPHFATYRSELITAKPTKGYVVFWFVAGTSVNSRLAARATDLRWSFRVACVGYTDEHCLFVAEKVREMFVGWRPDPSRAASPLHEVNEDPPLLRDEVEGDVRYSVTLRFALTTPLSS